MDLKLNFLRNFGKINQILNLSSGGLYETEKGLIGRWLDLMMLMWFIYNFVVVFLSFQTELPYPQISLTSQSPIHLDLGTHGMNAPNKCSVVLVTGSALTQFQEVKKTVESLVEQMVNIPYAMIIIVDDPNIVINMTDSTPFNATLHGMSPAMVRWHFSQPPVFKQISFFYNDKKEGLKV